MNETIHPYESPRTPVVEPVPKAARQALLLWLGIVACSVVTLPVWGLFYEPPEPVAVAFPDRPERRADALDLPSSSAPDADIDRTIITASIEAEPAAPALDFSGLGLRGAIAPEGVNAEDVNVRPPGPASSFQSVHASRLHMLRAALKARLKAQTALLDVARDELARMETLAREGYMARNRLGEIRLKVRAIEARVVPLRRDLQQVETALALSDNRVSPSAMPEALQQ